MCVLAFAWRAHPKWPLIVAGNRDELHARPAAPLARWEDRAGLIAGRDLQSGGTWLGVSEQGRFAVVTNLRAGGTASPGSRSRGDLVAGLLAGEDPAAGDLTVYGPFNLILADADGAWFLSNHPRPLRARLGPGIYGLSNGALDEPWPKTLQLKALLLDWVVKSAEDPQLLLNGLGQESVADWGMAPSDAPTGPEAPDLAPIFIRHPVYGTRCSTVVAVDHRQRGMIAERRFDAAGHVAGETVLSFSWPDPFDPPPDRHSC